MLSCSIWFSVPSAQNRMLQPILFELGTGHVAACLCFLCLFLLLFFVELEMIKRCGRCMPY